MFAVLLTRRHQEHEGHEGHEGQDKFNYSDLDKAIKKQLHNILFFRDLRVEKIRG